MRGIMRKIYDYSEWYMIVEPIITTREYIKRRTFRHHGNVTVYEHSMKVSKKAYRIAKRIGADYKSAAIAGILHDFYDTPWQDIKIKQPIYKMHAFTHAKVALENSRKHYKKYLNPTIENAILRHMFPLNIIPPKTVIGYIITISDKISSLDFLTSKEAIFKTFSFLTRGRQ